MTTEKDVVLIHFEDQPLGFARVESIEPDHKRGWYHVKLLLLNVPLQVVTWILRDVYIDGAEFTMNGKKMRLEKVVCPDEEPYDDENPVNDKSPASEKSPKKDSKIISLSKRKEK